MKKLLVAFLAVLVFVFCVSTPTARAAIAFTDLNTPEIASSTDATSYTSASWTPASALIIAFVGSVNTASPPPNQPTMSGNGITWTAIDTSLTSDSKTRITMFAANGAGASAGVTTVSFGAQTQRDCQVSFLQVDGSDVANGVVQTIVQHPTSTATAATSLSITLSAASNSNNRPVAGFVNSNTGDVTPRTNWTEYFDATTDAHNLDSQYRSDAFDTTASASNGISGFWAGIAAEIKAPSTAQDTMLFAGD